MRPVRSPLAGLIAGLTIALAAVPSRAQAPGACVPLPVVEALAPLPFPNPYPLGLREPPVIERLAGVPGGVAAHDGGAARGATCATDARVSTWTGTGWGAPENLTMATYADGRMTALDEAEDDGTGREPTWRTSFTYNGAGRLTRAERARYVDGAFAPESRTVYAYEGRGYLTTATVQTHNGTGWRNVSRSLLAVDAGPYAYELISEFWEDGGWLRTVRLFYEHASDGRLLVQSAFEADGAGWLSSYRDRFAYDAAGRLTEHAFDTGTGSGWEPTFRTLFTYDEAGRLTAADAQEWFNAEWIPFSGTAFAYDLDGRLGEAMQAAVQPGGSTPVPVARDRFAYDGDGLLAIASHDEADSSGWRPERHELTAWQGGRVHSRESQTYAAGAWTPEEHLLLTYGQPVGDAPVAVPGRARLTVGPSPAGRATTIRLVLDAPSVVTVRVLDARGRVVARLAAGALLAGVHAWPLDTSRLATGVYAVDVGIAGHTLTGRLVVVR